MEGDNSTLALSRPNTAADSQSFDGAVPEVGIPSIDQREPIHEVDDSQLAGVSVDIAEDSVEGGGGAAPAVGVEVKAEVNLIERVGDKRKRGRPPRGQAKAPPVKKVKEDEAEEDVCFICFDGGSLVLCDRRGCPKAYHPACIKRDEEFFRSKARWNCGWHICSKCQKSAHYMCYTCTYSLCKGCTKDADYVCVRGEKGFCMTCMRTVMLIENNEQGNKEMGQVDFDDKSSWEYLFKVYWIYLKGNLSLTLDDLAQAKSPWKGDETMGIKGRSTGPHYDDNDDKNHRPSTHLEANGSKRRKTNEQLVIQNDSPIMEKTASDKNTSLIRSKEWATKDLLEFVSHMKNGDTSVLSQFDVQALLLDYIKINNLRDPHRKSQILCDFRLANLFGKPRVGHFEMLKLLEFHFLIQEEGKKDVFVPAGVVGTVPVQVEDDGNSDHNLLMTGKDKKRKTRSKKGEERAVLQTNLDEYAAIDVYNINLIYLRRSLMETLIEDSEKFNDKVVGSIVRIRICCNDQKQDIYRLVQVVGTTEVAVPYKIGNRTANVMLEVLNLDKKESISIDAISNQDFSEEECRRLRQSIRCGLVKRLTVGEIQGKAMVLQAVRLNDWLETEILRLSHLRDRASEKGRKKDLRECVEKIHLLKTPEERQRRLREIPEVHSDPKMDPNYESEENAGECNEEKQDEYTRPRYSGFSGKGNKSISLPKRDKMDGRTKAVEKVREAKDSCETTSSTRANGFHPTTSFVGIRNHQSVAGPTSFAAIVSETSVTPPSTMANSEKEKLWHYRDPNGKIQGPFSMVQLQKWSTTGYFPLDMRIWATNRQDDPLLLTDVLKSQFQKENGGTSVSKLCNSAQNLRILPVNLSSDNVDSSSSLASVNKSTDSPEQNREVEIPILYSPTPTPNNQAAEIKQSEFVDLPSPTPKTNSEERKVQEAAEEKQTAPLDCPVQDLNPSWGSASSLVVNGAQIPEIGDEWGGYSPTPPKSSAASDDHAATNMTSDIDQNAPPTPNIGTWDSLIEFSTLPEESVSDLLAEVDAMESRGDFVNRDDCFSSIEEFSPTRDLGKSDAFSSTCGNTDMGWSGDGNVNHGAPLGGTVGSESPQRSGGGGNFTTSLQTGNVGFSKANSKWGRQSFGGSGGGGYSRPLPPPKGQRVCKFYESGHCKKGALCNYLHP